MKPLKRGKYVVVGTLMLVFLGTIYAWSYFKSAISLVFPMWNQKQLSLTFTIMMILFALGGLLGGKLTKTISRRTLAIVSGGLMFVGFMAMSFLPTGNEELALVLMYIFYGGFTGLGVGIGYNVVLSGVNSWFPDKDGIISGVLLTGFGLGSLILGNIADKLIAATDLFVTFRILGIACAVVVIGGAFVLESPTEDTPLPPTRNKGASAGGKDYTAGEMVRRPTFWLYFCWNLCMSATGLLVINNAASIAVYFGVAATVGLLVSVFNSGGRMIVGWSMDHFGWKKTMFLVNGAIIAAGVLMVLGNAVGAFFLVLIGMLMAGISYGGGVTIQASLVRTFYGNQNYPVNFSTCNLVSIPAAIVGPMISAALVDAAGGAFGPTFIMVIVMGGVSLCLNFLIRKP
ncbi:MAG: MFS transporter [Oscillospiraceae bacterium]|nr:MFS transporter [Oscillospiraceae bacterium]